MPPDDAPVLVLAATEMELAPLRALLRARHETASAWGALERGELGTLPVVLAVSGIGKVNAAAALTAAALATAPRAALQVGVGGAYLGSFLANGAVAAASEELQLDVGLRLADGRHQGVETLGFALTPARGDRPARYERVPTHPGLAAALHELVGLPLLRFATLDAVTGDVDVGAEMQRSFDVSIESMEGAAAAQVADRLGLPFAEIRGVSNLVGERDKRAWDLRGAIAHSCRALRALLLDWQEHPATRALRGSAVPVADC